MDNNVSKEAWVAMFREIGLSDEEMTQWHRLFEARHPEGHGGFLAWLGLAPAEVDDIRKKSR